MNKPIRLPFLEANYFSTNYFVDSLLLVGGGTPPAQNWLKEVAYNKELWCIDHGVDCCYQAGLVPKHLIGDGDSASSEAWQWAQAHGAQIAKFPPEKDDTDTQLTLHMAEKEHKFVILTAALGGRFDHAYSTVFSFGVSQLRGCIADNRECIFFLHTGEKLNLTFAQTPKALSILPITPEVSITFKGVKWELEKAQITLNKPYAISNETLNNTAEITLHNGTAGIYICWVE